MRFLLRYFIKRLPREGFRSLSVPALSLALVLLICVMGGMKERLLSEYEYMMDSHPIFVEASDGYSIATDGLQIGQKYLDQFTDREALWSLYEYVDNVLLKRELEIVVKARREMDGLVFGVSDIRLITAEYGEINYYDGYNAAVFELDQNDIRYCAVSEDVLSLAEDGIILVKFTVGTGYNATVFTTPFTVAGTVNTDAEGWVICSYDMLSGMINTTQGAQRFRVTIDGQEVTVETQRQRVQISEPSPPVLVPLVGISALEAETSLEQTNGAGVVFYDGYDESIFSGSDYLCLVSEETLDKTKDGFLYADVQSKTGVRPEAVVTEFIVAGIIKGAGREVVYIPFQTATELGFRSDGQPPYTERIHARIADNRDLDEFKEVAMRSFTEVGVFINMRTFALTIYDGEFYDTTEALLQTIFFIDIATPFVYFITICVGFVASFLLTRRRRAEFAVMRSVGVNRRNIFVGTLFEQTLLCAVGAAIGCFAFSLTWGYVFIQRPLVFLGCYVMGVVFSAAGAARTDVLRLLRDKE